MSREPSTFLERAKALHLTLSAKGHRQLAFCLEYVAKRVDERDWEKEERTLREELLCGHRLGYIQALVAMSHAIGEKEIRDDVLKILDEMSISVLRISGCLDRKHDSGTEARS